MDVLRNMSGLDVVVMVVVLLAAAGIAIRGRAARDRARAAQDEAEGQRVGRRVVIVLDLYNEHGGPAPASEEPVDEGRALYGLPYVAPREVTGSEQARSHDRWLTSDMCDYQGTFRHRLMHGPAPIENDPTGLL